MVEALNFIFNHDSGAFLSSSIGFGLKILVEWFENQNNIGKEPKNVFFGVGIKLMAYKVIETIIQNKLILSQQTEHSKNFFVRYYNSLNKSDSYKSLRANKLEEAKKKERELYDEQKDADGFVTINSFRSKIKNLSKISLLV